MAAWLQKNTEDGEFIFQEQFLYMWLVSYHFPVTDQGLFSLLSNLIKANKEWQEWWSLKCHQEVAVFCHFMWQCMDIWAFYT